MPDFFPFSASQRVKQVTGVWIRESAWPKLMTRFGVDGETLVALIVNDVPLKAGTLWQLGETPCRRCGYNLQTRSSVGNCPECGADYNFSFVAPNSEETSWSTYLRNRADAFGGVSLNDD